MGFFVLLAAAGGVWVGREVSASSAGGEVNLTIPEGATSQQIAATLDKRHVIRSARFFRFYAKFKGTEQFKAGDYTFRRNGSYGNALGVMKKGPGTTFVRLTIPEGLTLKEIAERVGKLPGRSAATFLQLAGGGTVRSAYEPQGSTNLEGLLFPDTYFIDQKDDEAVILRRMVTEFEKVAREVGLDDAPSRTGVSPYQATVIASLVETEGKVEADRPKIAQVVYNRLAREMPLQIDATVIYAKGSRRESGQVLFKDLEIDSPYNTYKHKGLPPSPISAVGRAALRAAVAPQKGPWLFYVKYQSDGTHKFAVTGEEHNRNVADAKRRGVNP